MAAFDHRALLYGDEDTYLAGTVPFIEAGLAAGESVMVSVPAERLDLIEAHLDVGAGDVMLVPMEQLGRNPAWIIPAWADFVAPALRHRKAARGIGEPIWASRSPDELVECVRHEQLLNLALAGAQDFQLLCPYDTRSLEPEVIETAHRNHPAIEWSGTTSPSRRYSAEHLPTPMTDPLPAVPDGVEPVLFDEGTLWTVREAVTAGAESEGLRGERLDDLTVAVSEALANSIRHGGGGGEVLCWGQDHRVLCEVRDRGTIVDPMAGRVRPGLDQDGGRGLWLMNQLCDLVQIRSRPDGTQVVRLHMAL